MKKILFFLCLSAVVAFAQDSTSTTLSSGVMLSPGFFGTLKPKNLNQGLNFVANASIWHERWSEAKAHVWLIETGYVLPKTIDQKTQFNQGFPFVWFEYLRLKKGKNFVWGVPVLINPLSNGGISGGVDISPNGGKQWLFLLVGKDWYGNTTGTLAVGIPIVFPVKHSKKIKKAPE
jgi:hypothetical protein